MLHALQRAHRVALAQQAAAAQQFGQHDAGGEHVHRRRRRGRTGGFGRHVARRADDADRVGARRPAPASRAAMPKSITRARPSLPISRFDGFRSRCTMPCACAAASADSTPSISVTASRAGQGAALAHGFGQRRAGHVLEHQPGLRALLVGLEHRHDVRMRQPADGTRFVQPLADRLGIRRRIQALQRRPRGPGAGRAPARRSPARRGPARASARSGPGAGRCRWRRLRSSRCPCRGCRAQAARRQRLGAPCGVGRGRAALRAAAVPWRRRCCPAPAPATLPAGPST